MDPKPLLALGLDPWQRNKEGETIAHVALKSCHRWSLSNDYPMAFLGELLEHDPSLIRARDYSGNTLLHKAYSLRAIMSLVVRHGADMTAVNQFGFDLLTQAVICPFEPSEIECLLKLMKDQGLGADSSTDKNGWTALHHAAFHRNEEAVRLLIKYGANSNFARTLGRRPLHLCGYPFSSGFPPTSPDFIRTPRRFSSSQEWPRAEGSRGKAVGGNTNKRGTALLLRSGADATLLDNDGNLPFFLAAASFCVTETFWMVRSAASGGLFNNLVRGIPCKKRKGSEPSIEGCKRLKKQNKY
eukprot:scaffold522_cov168-Amphora_coffeaeformis.AAC.3